MIHLTFPKNFVHPWQANRIDGTNEIHKKHQLFQPRTLELPPTSLACPLIISDYPPISHGTSERNRNCPVLNSLAGIDEYFSV